MQNKMQRLNSLYSEEITLAQLNLLDSHDTARFLSVCGEDLTALKLAAWLLFTFVGVPMVYYGTEVGMLGLSDPDCRRTFSWDKKNWNHEIRDHFKKLIKLREERPELRTGKMSFIPSASSKQLIFMREKLLVIINAGETAMPLERDISIKHLIYGSAQFQNGRYEIPPREAACFQG